MTNDELLHKYIEGTLRPEELEEFRKRPEFEALTSLYQQSEGWKPPDFDQEAMLIRILASKDQTQNRGKVVAFPWNWAMVGVAAAAIILALVFWPSNTPTVIFAQAGEQISDTLPDGSRFTLNAGSKIDFLAEGWGSQRTLSLEGEAYFEVKEGSKFSVNTSLGQVSVLGTQFNVRERGQTLKVSCQSGKVSVKVNAGPQPVILLPGQVATYSLAEGLQTDSARSASPPWLNGLSRFRDVPLEVALAELERQFGVEVQPGKIDVKQRLSCNFQHLDLELALKSVLGPLNVGYRVDGQQVFLSE